MKNLSIPQGPVEKKDLLSYVPEGSAKLAMQARDFRKRVQPSPQK
jgi:hypothetical protein